MTSAGIMFNAVAVSHTGLVRKNNQDSGYAGPNFLLVADGMGGHAGGDVASAITVSRLAELDDPDQGPDALDHLRNGILDANERITNTVVEKPELAGMGTTVVGLLRSGDKLALAHIGDSRAYLMRDGECTQVTHDHTFVQMLVDEGKITEEEAEHHPQRSVVMRVLGDVGAAPELDLSVRDARIGDRWMLCSDGLTGFAQMDDIRDALENITDPEVCARKLVELALAGGGADNVTVVIGDVRAADETDHEFGRTVGSARINPQFALLGHADRPTELIDTGNGDASATLGAETQPMDLVDTREIDTTAGAADTANPAAEGANAENSDESASRYSDDIADWGDEPARRKKPITAIIVTGIVVLVLLAAGVAGYNYVRSQYYLAVDSGNVAVYRGLPQTLGPIELSNLETKTDIPVEELSDYSQKRLDQSIPVDSKDDAEELVDTFRAEAEENTAAHLDAGATDNATEGPTAPAPTDPGATDEPSSGTQGEVRTDQEPDAEADGQDPTPVDPDQRVSAERHS